MNITLLNRMLAQPWAIRRETLALFTQLLIGPEKPTALVSRATLNGGKWFSALADEDGHRRELSIPAGYVPLNEDAACACDCGQVPDLAPGVTCIEAHG